MRKVLVSLVVFGMLAALASAQERKSLQVFNDVSKQVQRYAYFTIFDDVSASIAGGVVTLTGRVTMPFKKEAIEKRVARVDGVTAVVNQLQVLPVSTFDEALRYQVARAIYGDPSFWHYASMANPPIHIIVEHGRVTLTGVVQDNVERMLARSLATGLNVFSVTSELKTDAEVRAALEKVN
jgi:hyperosmotically inducible protein